MQLSTIPCCRRYISSALEICMHQTQKKRFLVLHPNATDMWRLFRPPPARFLRGLDRLVRSTSNGLAAWAAMPSTRPRPPGGNCNEDRSASARALMTVAAAGRVLPTRAFSAAAADDRWWGKDTSSDPEHGTHVASSACGKVYVHLFIRSSCVNLFLISNYNAVSCRREHLCVPVFFFSLPSVNVNNRM